MQDSRKYRLQVFVDPLYGSERYVSFEPEWVDEVHDSWKWLIFRPHTPVTVIKFKNGESHTVHGHWAQEIRDSMSVRTDPGSQS